MFAFRRCIAVHKMQRPSCSRFVLLQGIAVVRRNFANLVDEFAVVQQFPDEHFPRPIKQLALVHLPRWLEMTLIIHCPFHSAKQYRHWAHLAATLVRP